jgi:3-oxoadipate enol-lactonase
MSVKTTAGQCVTVRRDGITLVYRTYGTPGGEPIVLLHGLGADHSLWSPQLARYPKEGYFLVVPDIRGHGDSDHVPTFEVPACADDLAAVLNDADIDATTVAGVSMGSLIAQVFASEYSERVTRLVLCDTFSSVHGLRPQIASAVATVMLSVVPARFQIRLIESYYDGPEDEPVRNYFRTQLLETDRKQLVQARRAVNSFDSRTYLDRISAPTLVLVGDENPEWFVRLAEETAQQIENARFQQVPRGSDPSNLTVPEAFDRAVLSFLEDGVSRERGH